MNRIYLYFFVYRFQIREIEFNKNGCFIQIKKNEIFLYFFNKNQVQSGYINEWVKESVIFCSHFIMIIPIYFYSRSCSQLVNNMIFMVSRKNRYE
jgi:hypothetical protein